MRDYTADEFEAIAALEKGSLCDDWCSWAGRQATPREAWETWGHVDPEMAQALADIHARHLRLNRGCKALYKRGLVERSRGVGMFPGSKFYYRLLPPLREAKPKDAGVGAPTSGGDRP